MDLDASTAHAEAGEAETETADPAEMVAELLREAEQHHAVYEATELKGEYDRDWPHWYATYAIEHGLDEVLGRPTPLDRVGPFLARAYADYEALDPKPAEGWSGYVGRRLADEL